MSAIYSTKVHAKGGRSGKIKSDDGLLDLQLAMPAELGGRGGATNPEQLFAGGYAACFENAVLHVTRGRAPHKIAEDGIEVTADVGLHPNGSGGFKLSVALDVTMAGVDQATAEQIVAAAHAACPYSNAIKGNIDVAISVKTRE